MEYRIATKEDIGLLMSIRMEMLRKVNELSDNYFFQMNLLQIVCAIFWKGIKQLVLLWKKVKLWLAQACHTLN